MTDETNALSADDEIRLLDLLLVVAENARLLIFGPILAGLAALGGLAGAAGLNNLARRNAQSWITGVRVLFPRA